MGTRKILICDDEPHIVLVVSTKLKNAGFEVFTGADGQEGYDLATRHSPDLVVTDYQMPKLSGLELCAKLRQHPTLQNVPVIMLTARGFSLTEQELADTNIRKILPKPFSPREVLQTVQDVLQAHENLTPLTN